MKQPNYSISALITNKDNQIVIVQDTSDLWFFPKGFYSGEYDEITTIKNKTLLETGLKNINFIKELETYERPSLKDDGTEDLNKVKRIKLMHFVTNEAELNPKDTEIKQATWVSYKEALNRLASKTDREVLIRNSKRIHLDC